VKRLSELQSDDPSLQQAQQLLSSVEPLAPSHERMWRVRRAMEEKRAARGAGWRRLWLAPRALGLAALLLLVGGGSTLAAAQSGALSAMIARVVQVIQLAPSTPPAPPARPQAKRAAQAPAREVAAAPAPVVTAQVEPRGASLPEAEEVAPAARRASPKHHARTHLAHAPAADNEIVRRAVKALRRDGDPALAARLLDEAHRKSPDGALAEEVMSLRVEAALARGDARAGSYAREYLARYPEGRYRERVQQALRAQ
jgi:hypothetical protein